MTMEYIFTYEELHINPPPIPENDAINIEMGQDLFSWKTIHRFSEIEVRPNTLILCDIDDTILHHPAINQYWEDIIHIFFSSQCGYNASQSEEETTRYLDKVFAEIPMRHTDKDGFFEMLASATDFAFVTARDEVAKDFTYDNLRCIGVDPDKYPVHFCGGRVNKGEYIQQYFDLSKYEHVVFIDDQPRNLENVFLLIFHPGLEVYQFDFAERPAADKYYPFPAGFPENLGFDGTFLIETDQQHIG
jgi:hypothetical protein